MAICSFQIVFRIPILFAILFLLSSCSNLHQNLPVEPVNASNKTLIKPPIVPQYSVKAPLNASESACIDVYGIVLGNPYPGSNVSLYRTNSTNYTWVMHHIRTRNPVSSSLINESKEFRFDCLNPGDYAFVIPSANFDMVVGSPLTYEFECENHSLEIAFQGGDYEYAVGAFSIERAQNIPEHRESSFKNKGGLYRDCPLDS